MTLNNYHWDFPRGRAHLFTISQGFIGTGTAQNVCPLNDAHLSAFIFLMRSNRLPRSPLKNPFFPGGCGLVGELSGKGRLCVQSWSGSVPFPVWAPTENSQSMPLSHIAASLSQKAMNKMSSSEDFLESICSQTFKTIIY